MTQEDRCERTARLLALRLEEVALALERSEVPLPSSAECRLELAAAATRHAVDLKLLTAQRAREIWTAAARRHRGLPALPQ